MAMTELLLVFIGTLATLATLGLFVRFDDRWTGILLGFLASALWAILGFSAYDITMPGGTDSEPVMPLVVIGFGLGALVFLYSMHDLFFGATEEAAEANIDLVR